MLVVWVDRLDTVCNTVFFKLLSFPKTLAITSGSSSPVDITLSDRNLFLEISVRVCIGSLLSVLANLNKSFTSSLANFSVACLIGKPSLLAICLAVSFIALFFFDKRTKKSTASLNTLELSSTL